MRGALGLRRARWAGALAAVVLAGCGVAEEAAELVASGGETRLRDPVRPLRGGPRVLVFALDGVGYEALERALDEGRLSRFARGLGVAAADVEVRPMTTVLPSITMAAWTTLFTGEPPARTGVPGNEWFERDSAAYRAPAPVSVEGKNDALEVLTDGLLGRWVPVPTLFERADVRSHVALLALHRGADYLTVPDPGDMAELLAAFPAGIVEDEPPERDAYAELDRSSAEGAVAAIEDHGVPELQVVYFPGVDLWTHVAPEPLDAQQRYVGEVLDTAMAGVLEAYRRAGALEGTRVVVVADHGHTPVPSDGTHALGEASPLEAVLDSLGWRRRPAALETDETDFQAVLAYQGAFAYLYLADRSACPDEGTACEWSRPPPDAAVDSLASTLHGLSAGGGRLGDALEMILRPRRDDAGRLTGIDRWTDAGPRPLASVSAPGDTAFLALEERLGWLLDGPAGDHAGDLLLAARSGAWVPLEGRFYFSHPYRSWHGSAHRSDSRAPLAVVVVGGGDLPLGLPESPTQLDFTPLVLRLLGLEAGRGGR